MPFPTSKSCQKSSLINSASIGLCVIRNRPPTARPRILPDTIDMRYEQPCTNRQQLLYPYSTFQQFQLQRSNSVQPCFWSTCERSFYTRRTEPASSMAASSWTRIFSRYASTSSAVLNFVLGHTSLRRRRLVFGADTARSSDSW